jgi:phosphate transport system permease protein
MSATAATAAGPARHVPARDPAVAAALGRRRRFVDALVRWLCVGATAIGLFFLASLLATLLWRGLGALDWTVLTREFQPTTYGDPDAPKGGLSHAIVGTLIHTSLATLLGTPTASCPTCCCRRRPS